MKIVLVTMKVVDEFEAREQRKRAKMEGRLPVVSVITDEYGQSLWLGEEFVNLITNHVLDGNIATNQIVFIRE